MEYQQLMEQSGICATFHIFVKYRQNATWQGILARKEGQQEKEFCSEKYGKKQELLGKIRIPAFYCTGGKHQKVLHFTSG